MDLLREATASVEAFLPSTQRMTELPYFLGPPKFPVQARCRWESTRRGQIITCKDVVCLSATCAPVLQWFRADAGRVEESQESSVVVRVRSNVSKDRSALSDVVACVTVLIRRRWR